MNSPIIPRVINTLTEEEPSYNDLVKLYNDLRRSPVETSTQTVSQRALAQIVSEFIDYLDFVSENLEKSFGIPRSEERERILNTLSQSEADDPVERVSDLVHQWENIEKYTQEDMTKIIEEGANKTTTEFEPRTRFRTDS